MLMHSFSSEAIFHVCDVNLKMQRNLPAEMIKIGVKDIPGQERQTYFQSVIITVTRLHVLSTTRASMTSCYSGK